MAKPSDTLARLRARSIEAGRFVLPLEPVWADKLNDAYSALRRAELLEEPERAEKVAEARANVASLEATAGDNVEVFRFRRISRVQYDELVSAHPPSAAQVEREKDLPAAQRSVFDLEEMRWALLAEVCIDPPLSPEEAKELICGCRDDGAPYLSRGESESLVNAAMAVALSMPRQLPKELALP